MRRTGDSPPVAPALSLLLLFSTPCIIYWLSLSLSLLVLTQIRGHMPGSASSLPTTVRALELFRKKISALDSLAD